MDATAQKITTFLMFEGNAEEAMTFYISLFDDAEVISIARYDADGPGPDGSVQQATFALAGPQLMCIGSPAEHDCTFSPGGFVFRQVRERGRDRPPLCGPLRAGHGAHAAGKLRLQQQVRLGQRPVRRLLAAEPARLSPAGLSWASPGSASAVGDDPGGVQRDRGPVLQRPGERGQVGAVGGQDPLQGG